MKVVKRVRTEEDEGNSDDINSLLQKAKSLLSNSKCTYKFAPESKLEGSNKVQQSKERKTQEEVAYSEAESVSIIERYLENGDFSSVDVRSKK